MDYEVALAPDLGISSTDFIAAWNRTPECRAAAEARASTAPPAQFDPALAHAAIAALIGVATSVAGNALYDLLLQATANAGARKRTQIRRITKPDGTEVLVITIEEETR